MTVSDPPPGARVEAGSARPSSPLSGRRAQAARNDQLILEAARAVFLADPTAPITAVAKRAGVGISALYTRYGSKEELLRKLCRDGLQRFVDETEAALADERDDWTAFADYMRRLVDADTSSMTLALAGSFTPTEEMFALAERANRLLQAFFARVRGVLRDELDVHDLSMIFELVAAIKVSDRERTEQLRRRYLGVILDGLRADDQQPLPGPAPTWRELDERWIPS
jgi:AcrR family transcriptional regulator